MTVRSLLLVVGAGAVLSGAPCAALTSPGPVSDGPVLAAPSDEALRLLERAAQAARTRTWSGTQHVVTVRDGQPSFTVLQVSHRPGAGSAVQVMAAEDQTEATGVADVLDSKALSLLAGHYDLVVAGRSTCSGRRTVTVEARRPGDDSVAGRFWVDSSTGLVLRRDVLDARGAVVRSSVFKTLALDAPPVTPTLTVTPTGTRLDTDALGRLEADGWPVVHQLPSGLELFEARMHDGDVLQLSYSDGLSSLSLFVQEGELAHEPDGVAHRVGDGTVWVTGLTPERVVWSGEGRTWTLVSDAPVETVSDALLVLPHSPAPPRDDGVASRVWRGMSRVGGWLNPFT